MSTKKTYHHGNLHAELLQHAESILKEKGAAGISLREVAKAAGVSHAAPYRHFQDKQALLYALAEQGFRQLLEEINQALEKLPNDPYQQLKEAMFAYLNIAMGNPELFLLMFSPNPPNEQPTDSFVSVKNAAFDGFQAMVQQGIDAGFYIPMPSLDLTAAIWSMCHGFATLTVQQQFERPGVDYNIHEKFEALVDLILNGIKAQPSS